MKYVYGRKKWLAAGIAALLISGTGAVSDVLAAPVYTSGITTKAKKDKATFGSAYKVENGVNQYNLEDGSKISIHGTYHAEGITPGKGTTSVVTVGDGTGTLSIDTSSSEAGNSQGAGILASDGSRLTINGNLQIKTYGGSCFSDGIYMMRAGTGTGAKANITVNGNVYIGDPAAVGEPPIPLPGTRNGESMRRKYMAVTGRMAMFRDGRMNIPVPAGNLRGSMWICRTAAPLISTAMCTWLSAAPQ